MTRGSFCTLSIVPSASTLPFVQHGHVFARCRATKSMSCSITTTVLRRASALQQLRRALRLLVGHAGHRLVEQQQLRLLHEQHADLEPLLLAVREQPARFGPPRLRGRRVSSTLVDALVAAAQREPREQRSQERACRAVIASSRFSNTVWSLEDRRLLELAADAERARSRLRAARQIDALSEDDRSPSSGASCR